MGDILLGHIYLVDFNQIGREEPINKITTNLSMEVPVFLPDVIQNNDFRTFSAKICSSRRTAHYISIWCHSQIVLTFFF